MSTHPNVATIERMTDAVFNEDHATLAAVFTDDFVFHFRAPHAAQGDHQGLGGFLETLGALFEATSGDIKLDQKFCMGAEGWAAEWEHATFGRNGKTLESDNSFVYRFEDDRIAEMWMFIGALPEPAEAFFA